MGREDGASQTMKDLLDSFRVREPGIFEIVWFAIGAVSVAFLFWGAAAFERRRRNRRPPPAIPESQEPRREYHRVMLQLPADLVMEGIQGPLHGTLVDLSQGGASILVDHPLPKGAKLTLRFIPGPDAAEHLPVEVVRNEASPWSQRHCLHCRFIGLNPLQERHLEHVVTELERAKLRVGFSFPAS